MKSILNSSLYRLSLVALVAASAGVWSQLHAAPGSGAPFTKSRSLVSTSADGSSVVQLAENGDGTAITWIGTMVGLDQWMGTLDFANTSYTISTHFPHGQSGNGAGSGEGQFTMESWLTDLNTGELTGPFLAHAELAVSDTTSTGARMSQGVTSQVDTFSGEVRIVREHIVGNQAWGDTSGSLSIRLDGELVAQSTGGFGLATADRIHDVVRIR
jgi:hypothetical protein